jgi:hypothetical protein
MSHLTREQRDCIDNALKNRQSFKTIARHLGVAPSTVFTQGIKSKPHHMLAFVKVNACGFPLNLRLLLQSCVYLCKSPH